MFWHFFALATLGKPAVALAIIASAYGAGSALVSSDYRTSNLSAHETPRPQTSPKPTPAAVPTTAPKLDTSDPKVRECFAKYEALKTLKTGDPKTFEAALSTFKQTCTIVLGMRG